jgi:probable rRNA maturation factor
MGFSVARLHGFTIARVFLVPVELRNAQRRVKLNTRGLKQDAQKLLSALELQEQTVSLLLTGDEEMTRLNGQWMGEEKPTDVLAFPQQGLREETGDKRQVKNKTSPTSHVSRPALLGDIVISLETAQRRRPEALEQEVRRYLVHGLLHLVGHDHAEPEQRLRMQQETRRLLKVLHDT